MQSSSFTSFVLFASLLAGVEMCTDSNASCSNWVANGFCTSTFYTTAQKTQHCAASCGLCSGVSSTVSSASSTSASGACADTSPNCSAWASNGFCTSTFYTQQHKAQYCSSTCSLCGTQTAGPVSSDSTTPSTATTSS